MAQLATLLSDYATQRQIIVAQQAGQSDHQTSQGIYERNEEGGGATIAAAIAATVPAAAASLPAAAAAASAPTLPSEATTSSHKRRRKASPRKLTLVPIPADKQHISNAVLPAFAMATPASATAAPVVPAAAVPAAAAVAASSASASSLPSDPLSPPGLRAHSPFQLPVHLPLQELGPEAFVAMSVDVEGFEHLFESTQQNNNNNEAAAAATAEGGNSFTEALAAFINRQQSAQQPMHSVSNSSLASLPTSTLPSTFPFTSASPTAAIPSSSPPPLSTTVSVAPFSLSESALNEIAEMCLNDPATSRFLDRAFESQVTVPAAEGDEMMSPNSQADTPNTNGSMFDGEEKMQAAPAPAVTQLSASPRRSSRGHSAARSPPAPVLPTPLRSSQRLSRQPVAVAAVTPSAHGRSAPSPLPSASGAFISPLPVTVGRKIKVTATPTAIATTPVMAAAAVPPVAASVSSSRALFTHNQGNRTGGNTKPAAVQLPASSTAAVSTLAAPTVAATTTVVAVAPAVAPTAAAIPAAASAATSVTSVAPPTLPAAAVARSPSPAFDTDDASLLAALRTENLDELLSQVRGDAATH